MKWILPKELAMQSIVYSCIFFKEIKWSVLSCLRRMSAWPSLLTTTLGTFSLPESQCISTQWTVFLTQAHYAKPIFSPFVKIFLIKICFAIHITHSINFTRFALLSYHQKFDDFSSMEGFDLLPFWIASKQIFLWE